MSEYKRRLAWLWLVLLPAAALSDGGHALPMWQIQGKTNTVYLLGSVHLLRASDHPLPSAIDAVYADAETLVMELDMDDLDPVETQAIVAELSAISDGRTLSDLLGSRHYSTLEKRTSEIDIPLGMFNAVEPWYVAITIEQLMLMRIGMNQEHGIESHFVGKAGADGKEIIGLESIRQQLGFLDGLSAAAQRDLLLQVLDETDDLGASMAGMITAWRHGDTLYLEENMLADMMQHRELYRRIVLDRNKDWVRQIRRYLTRPDDYLVIVGTLHLIGDDGVPTLLRKHGFSVEQMHQQ